MNDAESSLPTLRRDEVSPGERAVLAAKLANRARLLRHRLTRAQPAEYREAYLAFNGGRDRYGVALSDVLEMQPLEFFTPVPHTPPFIAGVLHWRGAILSLLDLGKLFQSSQEGLADYHTALIVEGAGVRVAIIAREVEEVLSIAPGEIKPAPAGTIPVGWVAGVCDENRLLIQTGQILGDPKLVNWRES